MNNFSLRNHFPIPFNYLLFLKRFYNGEPSEALRTYPKESFIQIGSLQPDEFHDQLSDIWGKYIDFYQELIMKSPIDIHTFEVQFTRHHQNFVLLFKNNENGIALFRHTWNIFMNWWWLPSCGLKGILEQISDEFMSDLPVIPLNQNIMIQVVFDHIPDYLPDSGHNFIMVPIQNLTLQQKWPEIITRLRSL